VVIIIALLGMLIRVLMQPLHVMTRAMQDIADGEGDLTRRLTIQNHDEFGILGNAFNRFVERTHTSIREVSSATGQVNEVALRVVSASNSSMINSDEQANRTNSVAAAINQLGAAAQESAQQVQKMIEELQVGARDAVSTMSESQRHSLDSVEIANLAGERLSSVTQRSGSDFDLAGGDASIYWPASRCFC
jgi:methyl-accepting chemotaxis protein